MEDFNLLTIAQVNRASYLFLPVGRADHLRLL